MKSRWMLAAACLAMASGLASAQVFTAGPGLGLAVPDDTYNGTQGSMLCHTIAVPSGGGGGGDEVTEVTVQVRLTHSWLGDLTIKLFGPGATATLVSRPGTLEVGDNGTAPSGGESSDLLATSPLTYEMAATTEAELMGQIPVNLNNSQTVCVDGGTPCDYNPSAGSSLSSDDLQTAFDGTTKVGNWQLCIGDGEAGDPGTLDGWTLTITSVPVELLSFTVED